MLRHLTIKNYALIKHLELEPSAHLNVITGETGAGKSIMLGAIGLLMGNRADTKVLWDASEKCIIEGTFDIASYKLQSTFKTEDLDYDNLTVLRREISPEGKSRAFINDTPVTLDVMRKVGNLLMDIHSQHETLLLGNQRFQLQLVDAYAHNQNLMDHYTTCWSAYLKSKKEFETLLNEAETLRQEADYIQFQLDELRKAELHHIQQDALESELKIMEHAEEIKTKFNQVLDVLNRSEFAARNAIAEARGHLQSIGSYSQEYATLHQRLESLLIELDDILSEVEKEENNIEFDPQRADIIKEKLSSVYHLLKKHKVGNLEELLALQETLQTKADITSNLDDALERTKVAFDKTKQALNDAATKLSESRIKVFSPLCREITKLLKDLGIPEATLTIERQQIDPILTGADKIEILFSANKGIPPRPLSQVASGGEFSRLMFCIKYVLAEKTAIPTLILDEIDNGISGEIAIKLGGMMKTMAANHQLITITHLPQIAAKGDIHYYVFKDNAAKKTISAIKKLEEQQRIEEIAKMISGENPSKAALEGARELLIK